MTPRFPDDEVARWFADHTLGPSAVDLAELLDAKRTRGLSISVCLPALNEARTVGTICQRIRSALMDEGPFVDELIVVDSGSTDDTIEVARNEGAVAYSGTDLLPGYSAVAAGKGGALWKSVAVATGDIIVWTDSDVTNFSPAFITSLAAPLLASDEVVMVKGFYERPLETGDKGRAGIGARVTELAVRPLLNMFAPHLSGMIQPLSGECAILRRVAARLPFFSDYGVDVGLLIDVAERFGIDPIVQVDLGTKLHANQDVFSLGRMAHQVIQVMLRRFEDQGILKLLEEARPDLVQFLPPEDIVVSNLKIEELSPIADIVSR